MGNACACANDLTELPPPRKNVPAEPLLAIPLQTLPMRPEMMNAGSLASFGCAELRMVHGRVKATWAAVDDRSLWIRAQLSSCSIFTDDLHYLVVEYVGC